MTNVFDPSSGQTCISILKIKNYQNDQSTCFGGGLDGYSNLTFNHKLNRCCKFRYFKKFVQTQQLSCYVCDKVFEVPKFTILINFGDKI